LCCSPGKGANRAEPRVGPGPERGCTRSDVAQHFLQPPQAHRDIDEVQTIVFPAAAQMARCRRQQLDEERLGGQAALEERLDEFQQSMRFELDRKFGQSLNLMRFEGKGRPARPRPFLAVRKQKHWHHVERSKLIDGFQCGRMRLPRKIRPSVRRRHCRLPIRGRRWVASASSGALLRTGLPPLLRSREAKPD
jgi:hypothetical protein